MLAEIAGRTFHARGFDVPVEIVSKKTDKYDEVMQKFT
jgi:hypothetical protein